MKILLDTNIIVDVLSKRDGCEDSVRLIKYCELARVQGFVSATSVTDIMYILRKYIEPTLVHEAVQTLLFIIDVADVLKSDIQAAFLSDIKDYEDAVQACCAVRIKADYIVTRDIKDFKNSIIPAISAQEALKIMTVQR
jgi:predicted nucleic acid-binding protein